MGIFNTKQHPLVPFSSFYLQVSKYAYPRLDPAYGIIHELGVKHRVSLSCPLQYLILSCSIGLLERYNKGNTYDKRVFLFMSICYTCTIQ